MVVRPTQRPLLAFVCFHVHKQLEAGLKQSSTKLSGIRLLPHQKDESESTDGAS